MLEDPIKKNPIYHYLLGTLSEAQQEQLEEEYFSQPERRQELWAIFDEMVERFSQKEMDSQDAQKFAEQLQTKPVLRERAERLHTLFHLLSSTSPPKTIAAKQTPDRPTSSLGKWLTIPVLRWGVVAACALLLGLGGIVLSRRTQQQVNEIAQTQPTAAASGIPPIPATPTARPAATSPIKPKPEPPPLKTQSSHLATFYILLENTRAMDEATRLSIGEQTQTVTLHFEVQPPFQSNYQGVAQTSSGQIFKSFTNLKVQKQEDLSFVTIRLAMTEIPSPDFTIQIQTNSASSNTPPLVSQIFHLEKK